MTREEIEKIASDYLKDRESELDMLEVFAVAKEALEQKPKTGRWILTDVERDTIWRCNCSECGKDPQDYIYGSEDWWLTYGNLPKFCPTCGSRNF